MANMVWGFEVQMNASRRKFWPNDLKREAVRKICEDGYLFTTSQPISALMRALYGSGLLPTAAVEGGNSGRGWVR